MNPYAILNFKEGFPMKRIAASLLTAVLVLLIATPLCRAVDYDFKKMTPEIQKALKGRQSRYHQLQALKQEGAIGENNKGYVTGLKDSPATATMTASENQDRRVIYEALAEQNKLGNTGLLEVQKAFAEVQQDKAGAGDMVQSAAGAWKKKS